MTVVLLHALPLDERMWESQREVLAADTVVTPRLYELGSSMDEWAEKILDRVEGRFAAIGASMGGYCALAIARRAPERVSGLGLVGSRAEADPSERLPVRQRWLERIAAEGAEGIWAEMGPTVFGNLAGDLAEWVRSLALAQDPEGLSHAVAAIRDRDDARDVVASLPCPLLVAVGSADPLVTVEVAGELANSAPDGRVEVFDGAGHVPSLEQPERFNAVLLEFLGRLV